MPNPFKRNPKRRKPVKKITQARAKTEFRALNQGIKELHTVLKEFHNAKRNPHQMAKVRHIGMFLVSKGCPTDLEGLMRTAEKVQINCKERLEGNPAEFAITTKSELNVLKAVKAFYDAAQKAKKAGLIK